MSEITTGNRFEALDPREQLTQSLREFFLQALDQQRVNSAQTGLRQTNPAGFLHKNDGGLMKIHLQAPAEELVFKDLGNPQPRGVRAASLPPLWVLIPLPPSEPGEEVDLERIIMEAKGFVVHVAPVAEQPPQQFLAMDQSIGYLRGLDLRVEDLARESPPAEEEQRATAGFWVDILKHYDLRTISSADVEAA